MKILVYILPTRSPPVYDSLYRLFSKSKLFRIVELKCLKGSVGYSAIDEADQVMTALEDSYQHYPDNYTIIIKDTSVTNSGIHTISRILLSAINLNYYGDEHEKDWDLCYLTKWLDLCDEYKTIKRVAETRIVKTRSPFGIQSIMFSPIGRDRVLRRRKMRCGSKFPPITRALGDQFNQEIQDKRLKAIAISPNLFDFNVMLARNDLDYLKLSECRIDPDLDREEDPGVGFIPFFWFLSITVGIVAVAWFFYQIVGKEDTPSGIEIKRVKKAG